MRQAQKQKIGFVILTILLMAGTSISYHWLYPERTAFKRAETAFARQRFESARLHYQRAFAHGLQESQILQRLAESSVAVGDFSAGRHWYEVLLEQDPNNRIARIWIARILTWEGLYTEAIEMYRMVLDVGEAR